MHKHREESSEIGIHDADIDVWILRQQGFDGIRDKAGAGERQTAEYHLSRSTSQSQSDFVASLVKLPEHEFEANHKFPADLRWAQFVASPLEQLLLQAQLEPGQRPADGRLLDAKGKCGFSGARGVVT